VSYGTNKYWTFGENWVVITAVDIRKHPLKRILQFLKFKYHILKGILWADILMWHWDIGKFEYIIVKLLKKKVFVEWIGSDIRVPEIVFQHNPYYKEAWNNGDWDYMSESRERSNTIQRKFFLLNATPVVCVEISMHLNRDFFPKHITFFQRIDIRNYTPMYPSVDCIKPVLVHTPSATGTKGTRYVRAVISRLQQQGFVFTYVEIHNKSRQEALDAIGSADLFIDQFIVGSYGLATCEAMAMGKPVFCYLQSDVRAMLPTDCPIIPSTIDTLENDLKDYLSNPQLRHQTGIRSRLFAAEYHDADKIAVQLQQLFHEVLDRA
jgi:hypothetical protein